MVQRQRLLRRTVIRHANIRTNLPGTLVRAKATRNIVYTHLRKWIPGTAGGTVRRQVRTVYFATSSGFAGGASSPVTSESAP